MLPPRLTPQNAELPPGPARSRPAPACPPPAACWTPTAPLAGHASRNAALCLPCSDPPPRVPGTGHIIIICTPLDPWWPQTSSLLQNGRTGEKGEGEKERSIGPRCVKVRGWEHRGGTRRQPWAGHSWRHAGPAPRKWGRPMLLMPACQ